jgi:hypothetical protein
VIIATFLGNADNGSGRMRRRTNRHDSFLNHGAAKSPRKMNRITRNRQCGRENPDVAWHWAIGFK